MGNAVPVVNALSELRAILGPKGYSDDQDLISPWLTDWRGRFTGAAAALLSPATTEEVAAIVGIAAKYRLSLVPQGGNSGMVAGATPNSSGDQLILSMRRMNNITAIDADTGLISCEAGVILHADATAQKVAEKFSIQSSVATEENWSTEYGVLEMNVGVVDSLDAAADHIARFGTKHTEAIVTENQENAARFIALSDCAAVMVNTSTRFTDGEQMGFGAEIGISNQI